MSNVRCGGQNIGQHLEREFAKFIKERIGKGPSRTEVTLTKDVIVCLLDGFLTKAEELIVESGHVDKILVYRSLYVTQCISEIEEILIRVLNRKIKHFFPSWIPENNLACWTIYLD